MSKEWSFISSSNSALTGVGTTVGGTLAFAIPGTVLRMLGEYVIGPTSAITAGDNARVILGIALVSTDAATLGATAMPDPAGDADYPWLYWMDHPLFFPEAGAPLGGAAGMGSLRHSFDVKTMRKFKPKESLVFVMQYSDIAGNPPIQVLQGAVRCLFAT